MFFKKIINRILLLDIDRYSANTFHKTFNFNDLIINGNNVKEIVFKKNDNKDEIFLLNKLNIDFLKKSVELIETDEKDCYTTSIVDLTDDERIEIDFFLTKKEMLLKLKIDYQQSKFIKILQNDELITIKPNTKEYNVFYDTLEDKKKIDDIPNGMDSVWFICNGEFKSISLLNKFWEKVYSTFFIISNENLNQTSTRNVNKKIYDETIADIDESRDIIDLSSIEYNFFNPEGIFIDANAFAKQLYTNKKELTESEFKALNDVILIDKNNKITLNLIKTRENIKNKVNKDANKNKKNKI